MGKRTSKALNSPAPDMITNQMIHNKDVSDPQRTLQPTCGNGGKIESAPGFDTCHMTATAAILAVNLRLTSRRILSAVVDFYAKMSSFRFKKLKSAKQTLKYESISVPVR